MKSFSITGILGGKKAVKSLGAWIIILFGMAALIYQYCSDLSTVWLWAGVVVGFIVMLGGVFASDVPHTKESIED